MSQWIIWFSVKSARNKKLIRALKQTQLVSSCPYENQKQAKFVFPWWYRGEESACQCRGHRFDPCSGRIPPASEQLSPSTTATKNLVSLEPVLHDKRGQLNEKSSPGNQRAPSTSQLEKPLGSNEDPAQPKVNNKQNGRRSHLWKKKRNKPDSGPWVIARTPKTDVPKLRSFVYLFREVSDSLSDSGNVLSLFQFLLCECSSMHRSGMNSHLSIFNSYQHSTYRFAPSPTLPRLFCLEYFQANPRLCGLYL